MDKIELTFGIPVYNGEKYIEELLDCFKKTKLFEYEIIIIDDGSKDNTYKKCKEKIKNKFDDETEVKLYKQNNKGVSTTRNNIINKATGKWITFIDVDDLIDFEAYAKIFSKIKDSDYDYCVNIKNDRINLNRVKLEMLIEKEIINNPTNKFFRTDLLKNNNIKFAPQYSLGEDLLFNLEYWKVAPNKYFFCNDMYNYRVVNNVSLSRRYREDKYNELMKVNRDCVQLVNEINTLKSLEYIRIKNCISCIKDYIIVHKEKKVILNFIGNAKKYKKKKFILLNNFRTTFIYNMWYCLPNIVIYYIINNNIKISRKMVMNKK